MRIAFAVFLLLHGLAHLAGFVTPWQGAQARNAAGTLATNIILGGRVHLADGASRALSVLWLLAAIAFMVVAYAWWRRMDWSVNVLLVVALASLVLTLVWWPTARIGALINVALIVGLWLSTLGDATARV